MNAQANPLLQAIETVTCSRCGGSGQYSYCQTYGTTCFKCHGKGKVLSKRGEAANAYLLRLRSKPACEVKAGELIRVSDPMANTIGFRTVTESRKAVGEIDGGGFTTGENGERIWADNWLLKWAEGTWQLPSTELVRIGQTAEQKQATLAQALIYQSSLTKAGEPSKRLA